MLVTIKYFKCRRYHAGISSHVSKRSPNVKAHDVHPEEAGKEEEVHGKS
jgi:hypothetical protein